MKCKVEYLKFPITREVAGSCQTHVVASVRSALLGGLTQLPASQCVVGAQYDKTRILRAMHNNTSINATALIDNY